MLTTSNTKKRKCCVAVLKKLCWRVIWYSHFQAGHSRTNWLGPQWLIVWVHVCVGLQYCDTAPVCHVDTLWCVWSYVHITLQTRVNGNLWWLPCLRMTLWSVVRIGGLPWKAEEWRSAGLLKYLCEQEEPARLSVVEMNEVKGFELLREGVWKADEAGWNGWSEVSAVTEEWE